MKSLVAVFSLGVLLVFHPCQSVAQGEASKVFLLEDVANKQWCALDSERQWNGMVQDVGAMTVAILNYSNDRLSEIDVTQTDESGDWTVYDHYFLDHHGHIVKLSRVINVLPGDTSVVQTFSIRGGRATNTGTTATQLSTGKPLTLPKHAWLPDLPVNTATSMFPFSPLFGRRDLRTRSKTCAHTSIAN